VGSAELCWCLPTPVPDTAALARTATPAAGLAARRAETGAYRTERPVLRGNLSHPCARTVRRPGSATGPIRTCPRRDGQREWLLSGFQFELGIHDQPGWAAPLQALPQADATSPTAPARPRQVGPVTGALGHPPPADAVDPRGMHP